MFTFERKGGFFMSNTKKNDILHLNLGLLQLWKIAFCDSIKVSDVRFAIDKLSHYKKAAELFCYIILKKKNFRYNLRHIIEYNL